jgi:hypothetical protein
MVHVTQPIVSEIAQGVICFNFKPDDSARNLVMKSIFQVTPGERASPGRTAGLRRSDIAVPRSTALL